MPTMNTTAKLQPLGGMQGEERDAIRARVQEIGLAGERDRIEEAHAIVGARLGQHASRCRAASTAVASMLAAFAQSRRRGSCCADRLWRSSLIDRGQQRTDRRIVGERRMGTAS